MRVRKGLTVVPLMMAGLSLGGALLAAPVLHEFFDTSGVSGSVGTSAAGSIPGFPESLGTPSGTVLAPPASRPGGEPSYAQAQSDSDQYRLDGDTSRPDLVGYSDPFTPSVLPFKRSFAYDTVTPGLELAIADSELRKLSVGGRARSVDDQFFADLSVNVRVGQSVRIPSVGPQARILAARLQPSADFEIVRDSAENWFLRAAPGEYRLVMHVAIERRVFGSPFKETSWRALRKYLPALPEQLKQQTAPVLAALSLDQSVSPARALKKLVQHFRGFSPSDQRYRAVGAELYRAVTLSQMGVCRHRSFGFAVTALGLGLPTRFVRNEAHAWVEVYDGSVWHRIDLGGAAGRMEMGTEVDVAHAPPTDPFTWPAGSESGTEMASDALRSANQSGPGADPEEQTEAQNTEAEALPPEEPPPPALGAQEPATLQSSLGVTEVVLTTKLERATRGNPVLVSGQVSSRGKGCDLTRVDIKLQSEAGQWFSLGTLVTDSRGRYGGQVAVPSDVPVGDYELFALAAGSAQCAQASSLDSVPAP